MIPRSNISARQLTGTPQTHRADTLRAIADKTHATTERIHRLRTEGQRVAELLDNVPEDTTSRLTWLNSQLSQL